MKFHGFVGPTYELNSVNVDCQRCVNLIPEIIESGTGKEASTIYYKSSEGLQKIAEVGTGPIRMVHVDYSGQLIVVSGTEVYRLLRPVAGIETVSISKIGDIGVTDAAAKATDPKVDLTRQVKAVSSFKVIENVLGNFNRYITVLTDGSFQNYYYEHDDFYNGQYLVEYFGSFAALGYPPVTYATQVDYIDGYLVYIVPFTNKFYVSDWNNFLTVSALSFASAEGSPDRINAIQVVDRLLYVFNEKSIEVYQNSGNADFPFERLSGGFISTGNLAEYSPARINRTLFWLGRDEKGQGVVYSMTGLTPQRISTHAIEQAINKYANPQKAVGYCYARAGHFYYVLNFEEASWCYDLSTGLWHERCSTNEGVLERHRSNFATSRGSNTLIELKDINYNYTRTYDGAVFAGDYKTNKVYLLKEGHYYEDLAPLTRMRRAPHISAGGKVVFHKSLEVDMETGVGLDGGVQGSDPQVMMRFSNDGGHTWSSEALASAGQKIGGIGQYKTRVRWNRLGRARDRVYEIKVTDPVPVNIIGADLEVEVGVS